MPCTVEASWSTADGPAGASDPIAGFAHSIRLLGFTADATWDVDVVATALDGRVLASRRLAFSTDPLPTPFPAIRVDVSAPERMQPGATLLRWTSEGAYNWLALLDAAGQVRWLLSMDEPPTRTWWEGNGRIAVVDDDEEIREIDLDGAVLRTWSSPATAQFGDIPVGVSGFSHDLAIEDDGSFLALDHGVRVFPSFRTSYDDPAAHAADVPVLVDRVVRFDPADGEILASWDLGDLLDPERLGYDSLTLDDGADDWTHANAVAPLAGGGALVSLRHQDAIVALDADGSVGWIAAPPAGWTGDLAARRLAPTTEFPWFYHQHGPDYREEDGSLLVFDNGDWRASPGDGQPAVLPTWSRVAAFTVDPDAGTIAPDWEWQPADAPVFSGAEGNVQRLETGGVLAAFAYVTRRGGVAIAPTTGFRPAQEIELVELDADHAPVWDVTLSGVTDVTPDGWNAYRADRVPAPW